MTSRHAIGLAGLIALLCALTGVGCVDVVSLEYQEYVQPLDDRTELVISTYPVGFPRERVSLAPVYLSLRRGDRVALQFHVRDRNRGSDAGPRVESVHMQRLAYRLDGGPETVVLTDFGDGSWMQDTGTSRDRARNVILYQEHSVLQVTAALTVNGEQFSIAGEMPARRRFSRYPIVLYYLGR